MSYRVTWCLGLLVPFFASDLIFGAAMVKPDHRWPKSNIPIPYTIDRSLDNEEAVKNAISGAAGAFTTPVSFVGPLTPKQIQDLRPCKSWIVFIKSSNPESCHSPIGHSGRCTAHNIYLGIHCGAVQGKVEHEIGHALGLFHEHQRPDRFLYVNIDQAKLANLQRLHPDKARKDYAPTPREIVTTSSLYDFGSIMHYPFHDIIPSATALGALNPTCCQHVGQRDGLSAEDKKAIELMYGPSQ